MFIEDPIIRKSREKIQMAINKKFHDEGTRLYVNDNLYQILETICDFYNNESERIYALPKTDEFEILYILNSMGIHFTRKEFHSLKGVIQAILKERYRGFNAVFPEDLPEKISAYEIYGEYAFDDMICLNDTDFRQLKKELRFSEGRSLPTLEKMVFEMSEHMGGEIPRYHSYANLPYTKSLRRYQRLRMLDEIMAGADRPLSLREIHHKLCGLAEENGIDPKSLWKINSFECHNAGYYKRNVESIYKQDFLALKELIAPSERWKRGEQDVYSLDGYGGRRYLSRDMTAFKLVIPSSLAETVYEELIRNAGSIENFRFWKAPVIYAIVRFGQYHHDQKSREGMYRSDRIYSMKYYKTGTMLDYDGDDFYDYEDVRSMFDRSINDDCLFE